VVRATANPPIGHKSKTDLVNPLFEHGHWGAQAVTLGCLHFVAKQRPTVIDRAPGGSQSILRTVSQGMDYLTLIDNAGAADSTKEFARADKSALRTTPSLRPTSG
jgi:hypothetical protein